MGDSRVDLLLSLTGKFRSEDWSGNEHVWPVMVNDQDGTVRTELDFGLEGAAICWSVDITSLKAGLLIKKLTVNFQATSMSSAPRGCRSSVAATGARRC